MNSLLSSLTRKLRNQQREAARKALRFRVHRLPLHLEQPVL
jgi:hypothetical protein